MIFFNFLSKLSTSSSLLSSSWFLKVVEESEIFLDEDLVSLEYIDIVGALIWWKLFFLTISCNSCDVIDGVSVSIFFSRDEDLKDDELNETLEDIYSSDISISVNPEKG